MIPCGDLVGKWSGVRMKIAVSRTRSKPVYLQRDGGTVTLVFERHSIELTRPDGRTLLRRVMPSDVFVIDGEGVRLVSGRRPLAAVVCLVVAVLALVWSAKRSIV